MGWGDFPADCGNSIEVSNGTHNTPPPPPFRASWLVWSRFWPWNQVDTYVYSLLLVRTWKNKGGQLRKALSVVIYLGNIFIALSLVYVPSEIIVWTPPPPPPTHGGGSLRQYLHTLPSCLEEARERGPHDIALLSSVWLPFCLVLDAAAWHFSPGLPKSLPL